MESYEKLGSFYLGRHYDLASATLRPELLLYDAKDLVTHAVCVGMTGSGKTGLCVSLLEEAAIDGIPALVIDPKGDLADLLLTFPDLAPSDFLPWINEDDARRKNLSPEEYAAAQAELWRDGLAQWAQSGERIRRLRETADFAIYTPGSEAGLPVSILASFAAPPAALLEDGDLLRDRVASTATSLLGLLGIDADPLRSREHILLATLFDHAWREGQDLDLGALIQAIQRPPVTRVGVLDLDSFFPPGDRFELAMRFNNLLAAPAFQTWMTGEPLDVGNLLYTPAGKPRVAIFSIAHLSDSERMFFVSLLLNQTLGWMRTRPGTTSLRALLYMDEIFGFFPPVAEPPSKRPLLTLLKQARAFGLGVVLATQNPVDLDYKGLSNIGTWFIGRLQTERDKARVLEGLEGASAGGAFDRQAMERILAGLGSRVFLLHNVHDDAPIVFQTRWAMSYLCGPLTRQQIRRLTSTGAAAATPTPAARPSAASLPGPPLPTAAAAVARPVLPPTIPQTFLPVRAVPPGGWVYAPAILGLARVHYPDPKTRQTVDSEEVALLAPLAATALDLDWQQAADAGVATDELEDTPAVDAGFAELPAPAAAAANYKRWERDLAEALYRTRSRDLWRSPTLDMVSSPGESERDFRLRLGDRAREERDRLAAELRQKHAAQAERLQERLRRAQQAVEKERQQATQQKLNTAISVGATLLSALLGRSAVSGAKTAARGVARSAAEAQDVARAQETMATLTQKLEELNAELEAQIDALADRVDPLTAELETLPLRPRKSDIEVRAVMLAWAPREAG